MASRGSRILRGAREALDFASGDADPSNYRVHLPPRIDVEAIRSGLGMTQSTFATTFGLSLRTVQDWEAGEAAPDETGRAYLRVILARPDAVREALAASSE